ncbi:MAG: hypothetical protein OEQ39_02915 [Gammaproteobacteria bacterium]|nr:hypothetical protein [Gammaproteobacteria bacterium]MDH3375901.1 hypothetical protein [Gammaproteobacteria bacterium]
MSVVSQKYRDLLDVLVAIVNTAQTCTDRCMVDVCNDNFLAHSIDLRARLVPDNEDAPIIIERIIAQGKSHDLRH